MRVLVLAIWAPPQLRPQALLLERLLRHLALLGVEVVLLCATAGAAIEGVEVHTFQVASHLMRRVYGRLFQTRPARHARSVFRDALARGARLLDRRAFDGMLAFANPYDVNILGAILHRHRRAPAFVAHYSDPYVHSPFKPVPERILAGRARAEDLVLARARHVVFVNDALARAVTAGRGLRPGRDYSVIPHSFDAGQYPGDAAAWRRPDRWVLRHVGAFYGPRRPTVLLEAMRRVLERRPVLRERVHLDLVGADLYGAETDIAGEVRQLGLADCVSVLPVQPYRDSLGLMAGADVLVSVDAPVGEPVFLPSKLIDYLGARRPILCLTQKGSPAAALCAELGRPDLAVDAGDPEAVAGAIERLLAEQGRWSPPSKAVDRYAAPGIARQWRDLFEGLCNVPEGRYVPEADGRCPG